MSGYGSGKADLGNRGTFDNLKTIVFYEPDKGNSFVSICWPAMVGVISGMNDKGIVVSVMSSRSTDVSMEGMPISFLLKKVLQYANSIDEAKYIRHSRNVFELSFAAP